ncbi:MAG TPA: flavin reductase [Cryomorphaceae bacterium]|nr:flavin reductase [Owenweeksia sp.]MBF98487.1 flavin reductase [Owenweeksia sp.]HAD98575.1 flavin reductase [Cryomorphaceae bacterium]HBF20332.1 flavin reductase [Cryomorphaceae bacterium]HCQ15616.1 flavin reductase [Cryomorphaceae bacterium]|tara:strand:- start:1273 stop:2175 length:903 start_codon:yes stop_codon:yes gene_type:complete
MKSFDPKQLDGKTAHAYLLGAVGPRPIAFASTIDDNGNPNLSPFSYFNVFSSNPPILIFSPARRVRNNTTKDTLHNAQSTREVVINVVNYNLVQQASLASTEYDTGVNEFVKAGLTPIPSETVKPFRVKESPVQFECTVNDIVELGDGGGAGNLIICEVQRIHIDEKVMDANGMIDQRKIDLVARMGGNWYCRAHGDALFEVEKPILNRGIGVDQIPKRIRQSVFLDGNDLGKLGNVERLPNDQELTEFSKKFRVQEILNNSTDGMEIREQLHQYAKELLDEGKVEKAWKALLCDKLNRV